MSKIIVSIFAISIFCLAVSCSGEAPKEAKTPEKTVAKVEEKKSSKGPKIYKTYCIACHGPNGDMAINDAKDLTISELGLDEKIEQITNGKGLMTPFKDILSEEEIREVAEYTVSLIK